MIAKREARLGEITRLSSKSLKMMNQGLTPQEFSSLLEKLSGEQDFWWLANNFLGDEGLSLLLDKHVHFKPIKVLDLRNNDITDKGMQALAEIARHSHILYLKRNCVGDRGVQQLKVALLKESQGSVLTTLGLENNNIGNEGAMALVDMAKALHSLVRIDLTGNDSICPAVLRRVEFTLKVKQTCWFEILLRLLAMNNSPRLCAGASPLCSISIDLIRMVATAMCPF